MENRTFNQDGFTVSVQWTVDEFPELSHLGEYSSRWSEWSVDRKTGLLYGEDYDEDGDAIAVLDTGRTWNGSREYRYWTAPMGICYSTADVPDQDELIKYIDQDYTRIEQYNRGDWCMMGCIVTVTAGGVEVGHDSLYGIESDAGDYAGEVEQQCIAEAMVAARDAIPPVIGGLLKTIGQLSLAYARGY